MKAHAVVFIDKMHVAYQEVEVPEPSPTDVVIDVKHSWISIGTESSYLRAERISGEIPYHQGDPWPFPYVAGYQKVGTVRSVGSDVKGIQPGEHVFATCSKVSNMFFDFAGHVSPAVTDQGQVWKIPPGQPPLAYSGSVLAQVGLNCGVRPPVHSGDVAVVIGDGLVGQWAAQTLLHRGAHVVVLGRHQERLNYLPLTIIGINLQHMSIADTFTDQKGVNIVVDSVGAMQTFQELKPFMLHDSHLVSAGFLGDAGRVDIQSLREQEITLHCPSGWSSERIDQTLLGIAEGWLQTLPLITHHFPAEHAQEAWQTILTNKQMCLGVILDW